MPTTEQRLEALERTVAALVEQPKATAMTFAAIFGALADDPETIKKITGFLQDSLKTSVSQDAHVVVLSELSRTVTLLTSMLNAKH